MLDRTTVLTQTHQRYRLFLVAADLIGLAATWILAFYLRFHTSIVPVTKGIPRFDAYAALMVPITFLWLLVLVSGGAYREGVIMQRSKIAFRVLRLHALAFTLFMALTYLVSDYRFSRVTLMYFAVLSGIYLFASRLSYRTLIRLLYGRENNRRKVAIVGAGDTARAIAERICKHPELGLQLVGFFTNAEPSSGKLPAPVLGAYEDVVLRAQKLGLQQIVLAIPRQDSGALDRLLHDLRSSVIAVEYAPDIQDFLVFGCAVEDFAGFPVLGLNEPPTPFLGLVVKRLMDLALSFAGLLVLSPFLLLIALLVKLTSRGPIFYGQERMGLDGQTFKMWKFRSMRMDAEATSGPVWAKPNDDRRTPIGAFLRATSVDELPQLWNVLRGEMSLVGPRPERPQFVEQFQNSIPSYMHRHRVKAGLTGWAQVNGWRGDTSLEKRIEYDLYYIKNWTLIFDFKILLLTLFKGIINKNAY